MAEFKSVSSYKHEIEHQTKYYGADGWRLHKFHDDPADDSKVLIEFVRGE
ncbi:hypothetical protein [Tsukamurella spumae]|uniref:DUF4177 domain-containing protein n=1 Tax=Tsukamurella spumae TaxID=44753 RepID=A0A846X953_9ACTN|nr:hypothetical protein [Tsukamurella spumae]NKY20799.1 hypothetical protein [Tsukamurella spumae]